MENLVIEPNFWKDRKIFITGHTGFKGSWLSLWLNKMKATITGYALQPPTNPAIFHVADVEKVFSKSIHGDIRDEAGLTHAMLEAAPEIVIHMAAQPLVHESYKDPVGTYSTNVMGTVNLLEAVRKTPSVKAVLIVTSDKCYENKEWVWGYRENDQMGGWDPYSSSKGCVELISSAYRRSFLKEAGIALATARAGNVIGGGDWARDRIVPDAIRAFIEKKPLIVHNPKAIRPWQHVLDPLSGYLMLCQKLVKQSDGYTEGWNFGPDKRSAQPVSTLADLLVNYWGGNAQWLIDDQAQLHEACYLKLDSSRANELLKWKPVWSLERALDESVQWYKSWDHQNDMHDFTNSQIAIYQQEHRII